MNWVKKLQELGHEQITIPSMDEMAKTLDPDMYAKSKESIDAKIASTMAIPQSLLSGDGPSATVKLPLTPELSELLKGKDSAFSMGFDPGVDMGSVVGVLPGSKSLEFSNPITVKMSGADSSGITTLDLSKTWADNDTAAALKKALDTVKACIGIKEINLHQNYSGGMLPNLELNIIMEPTKQSQVTAITGWAFEAGAPKGIGKLK